VTECVESSAGETHLDESRYTTLCDPRLNGRQSLEVALELIDVAQPPAGSGKGGSAE